MSMSALIKKIPKAELHLHIEGTLEPELMWQLAQKHQVSLPYSGVADIRAAYHFNDLQSFLDLYYQGADVLRDEDDFYALMWAYLTRCQHQNVVHTEIMFDPQTHTQRGIGFDVFMPAFAKAISDARAKWGISVQLIMSFLRHLSEEDAFATLHMAQPYYYMIDSIGLDSSELGHPPEKFARVFAMAKDFGFNLVAHAGEEGPPEYIWQAINTLNIDRIDHGVRCAEDDKLVQEIIRRELALTVCPLSNLKLCVVKNLAQHNILSLLDKGVRVTVNSDDPSYFGGYLGENLEALQQSLGMNEAQLKALVSNSFRASFMPEHRKRFWLAQVDSCS